MYRNRRLLDAIRGLPCVCCGADDGTIVPAHANSGGFGKGFGLKASDAAIMALCMRCHALLDQGGVMTADERRAFELEHIARTLVLMIEDGRLAVATRA